MKKMVLFISVVTIAFAIPSCKKTDCNAGSGGDVTVVARMVHHSRAINGCTVYVKYCAKDFPGADTSKYDLSFKAAFDTPEVALTGLKSGDYYLYATGVDSLLDPSTWIVKGGIPFSTNLSSGSVNQTVFVTEGD
ncbi:hypothetical protein BH11BAC2_BH11BAC2_14480 [soil metagenome]